MAAGLAKSKGEARRTVAEGGAYLNNVRVEDPELQPTEADLVGRVLAGAAPREEELRGRRGRLRTSSGGRDTLDAVARPKLVKQAADLHKRE